MSEDRDGTDRKPAESTESAETTGSTEPTGSAEPTEADADTDEPGAGDQPGAETDQAGDDAPLSDLARRVTERRRDRSGRRTGPADPFEADVAETGDEGPDRDGADPFRKMSVAEIDEESLWAGLASGDEPTIAVGSADPAATAEPTDAGAGANENVVEKAEYCQKCPYLHEPPELACTHEGTEIVEVVDSERFRVRECPMVDE